MLHLPVAAIDPVARWLAVCRCVGDHWSVRLELRGCPAISEDLDLASDEQQRLLALWQRRERVEHFERLGLAPTDDDVAIRRAYLDTCRQLHPDRYYGKRLGRYAAILDELFDRARISAEFLAEPRRRARYLARLAREARSLETGAPLLSTTGSAVSDVSLHTVTSPRDFRPRVVPLRSRHG